MGARGRSRHQGVWYGIPGTRYIIKHSAYRYIMKHTSIPGTCYLVHCNGTAERTVVGTRSRVLRAAPAITAEPIGGKGRCRNSQLTAAAQLCT